MIVAILAPLGPLALASTPKPAAVAPANKPDNPVQAASADALAARMMQPAASKSAASPADLCFRHAGRALMVSSMAERFGRSADEKRQFGEVFQQLLDATAKEFSDEGTPYDLAKAFAYFVIVNYTVLHPDASLDEALSDRLLEQFRTQLLDSGAGRAADDAAKQSLYETLVILGGITIGGYQKGTEENDAETVAAMRNLAAESLKTFLRAEASQVRLDPNARLPLSLGAGAGGQAAAAVASLEAPRPAPAAARTESPVPAATGVVGAWWGMRSMLNGSSVQLQTEHLVFYADGTFAFDLPRRGLDNLDLDLARAEQLRIWGQYSTDGSSGVVTGISNSGEPFHITPKGALVMLGTQYVRCLCPAGMRLDGTYIVEGLGDTDLTFSTDGRFTDRGLLWLCDIIDKRPEFEQSGSGSYEIRNCSLILAYDDGRRAQVAFYLPTPQDAATSRPSTIVLNKMRRVRAQ